MRSDANSKNGIISALLLMSTTMQFDTPKLPQDPELGPSNLLVYLSIAASASRLWTECRKKTAAIRLLVPSWLGYRFWFKKAQGERPRFEKTRAEPERWMDIDVWSDGFLWVNILDD